ncbi:tryptophan--tRNA ligase [PVC group bacterium (ex Bugula neritina AB1)]|nr:tryptophan--tRNA ligase [PVC group bacterium (ex Bugula neritina AB1)]
MKSLKKRILSGMRPTGDLHIGHLFGVLENWVNFQQTHDCFFMVADWHALMGEYKRSSAISKAIESNIADWLAAGIDPEKASIFVQSDVPEHLELYALFSTLTPIPWLERCPTYKEQLQELKDKDIFTHAFLGYPVLQAADIALYRAHQVPVGKDQLPHLELTREIVRRFHHIFDCDIFPEPEPILDNQRNKILGIDRRKMSKSYNNHIGLGSPKEELSSKVKQMVTDPKRLRLKDPGHPDDCNVFTYYSFFEPSQEAEVKEWCEKAQKGCSECKSILSDHMNEKLEPWREKRKYFLDRPDDLKDILQAGASSARIQAQETLSQVRDVVAWRKFYDV